MCYGCWEEAGKPVIDTPEVHAAAALVHELYEHPRCGVGGNLHIVTDDWNLEDGSLAFCAAQVARGGHPEDPDHSVWYTKHKLDDPDTPDQLQLEQRCLDALTALPEEARNSALALEHGFWKALTSNG